MRDRWGPAGARMEVVTAHLLGCQLWALEWARGGEGIGVKIRGEECPGEFRRDDSGRGSRGGIGTCQLEWGRIEKPKGIEQNRDRPSFVYPGCDP